MILRPILKPLAVTAALAGLTAYATIMLRGPQGLSALTEKHREIQLLEEQNADLRRDIQLQRDRIERLKHDAGTQEFEVRKRTKMRHCRALKVAGGSRSYPRRPVPVGTGYGGTK